MVTVSEVLNKIEEVGVTPYQISANTSVSQATLSRILRGVTKNPNASTLNEIWAFLNSDKAHAESGYQRSINDEALKYLTENKNIDLSSVHPLIIIEHIYKNKNDFFDLLSFRELVKDILVDEKIQSLEETIFELKKSIEKILGK